MDSSFIEGALLLYIKAGLFNSYPEKFSSDVGSEVAINMNAARGGYFPFVPDSYSDESWFYNSNKNCSYKCQVERYTLLSMLSYMNGSTESYLNEWSIDSKEMLEI